jgi:hypothetical protein
VLSIFTDKIYSQRTISDHSPRQCELMGQDEEEKDCLCRSVGSQIKQAANAASHPLPDVWVLELHTLCYEYFRGLKVVQSK